MCKYKKQDLFGEICKGEMKINHYGQILDEEWCKTSKVRNNVSLDEYVIMPNHFHGILVFDESDTVSMISSTPELHLRGKCSGASPGSVGAIIGQVKSRTARRINHSRGTLGVKVWQRNYYEHVIRDDNDLDDIRQYIKNNPEKMYLLDK